MNKQEFLAKLTEALRGVPEEDVRGHVAFYSEMIDDRVEEGTAEEEAVRSLGTVERVAAQIVAETPLSHLIRERVRGKGNGRAGTVVLLILGAPLWLSLLISVLAVDLSLIVSLWSVVVSLWASAAALSLSVLAGLVGCAAYIATGGIGVGIAVLGAGLLCSGLGLLLLVPCVCLSKATWFVTKWNGILIKKCIIRGK